MIWINFCDHSKQSADPEGLSAAHHLRGEAAVDRGYSLVHFRYNGCAKDIELFFDASFNDDFVLTYDTVHRNIFIAKSKGTRSDAFLQKLVSM